jgi:HSP20 family molecular chaperone IbpA
MTPVSIQIRTPAEMLPLLAEHERHMDKVERRAYFLFEQRGGHHGRALDDWLTAESQILCLPQAQTTEEDCCYRILTALSGFHADHVHVTIAPQDIVIRAEAKCGDTGFALKSLTHYSFRAPIYLEKVTATMDKGVLQLIVPKEPALCAL